MIPYRMFLRIFLVASHVLSKLIPLNYANKLTILACPVGKPGQTLVETGSAVTIPFVLTPKPGVKLAMCGLLYGFIPTFVVDLSERHFCHV